MSEHPHGDTPPVHEESGLERRITGLEEFDKETVRGIIGKFLLWPAVQALHDGLEYRNKRGLPSRAFVREFNQIVKLSGEPMQIAAQIVALIGATAEVAKPIIEQHQQIKNMDHHELARRAMRSLVTYRSAFPAEFQDLCESFNLDVADARKEANARKKKPRKPRAAPGINKPRALPAPKL